jgi:hypothetical protein
LEEIICNIGVKQGRSLYFSLFGIYMDMVEVCLEEVQEHSPCFFLRSRYCFYGKVSLSSRQATKNSQRFMFYHWYVVNTQKAKVMIYSNPKISLKLI